MPFVMFFVWKYVLIIILYNEICTLHMHKMSMQASLTPKLKLCPINTGISITWIRCLASLFHLATREVRYQTPEASPSQKETIRELCYQLCLWKFLISDSLTWPSTLMIYTFKKTFYKMTVRNFYIYLI